MTGQRRGFVPPRAYRWGARGGIPGGGGARAVRPLSRGRWGWRFGGGAATVRGEFGEGEVARGGLGGLVARGVAGGQWCGGLSSLPVLVCLGGWLPHWNLCSNNFKMLHFFPL